MIDMTKNRPHFLGLDHIYMLHEQTKRKTEKVAAKRENLPFCPSQLVWRCHHTITCAVTMCAVSTETTRDQGLHKLAAFKTARHFPASVHTVEFESEVAVIRCGRGSKHTGDG